MNITNADYFTFNVDNSIFIAGQTGSGKSYLVHKLIDRLQAALSPDEVRFVFFDLKQIEFNDTDKNYLYENVIIDPEEGLQKLDELANLSNERMQSKETKPQIFIYIEECDMAAVDQKRFDRAVIQINNNAKDASMKLIYSTSRPALDVVSKELLASFDLIMAGQLASGADAKHLGVPYSEKLDRYSFLVSQHDDLYDAEGNKYEMMDISKLDTSFGGDNEPHDDRLSDLLSTAYRGEIDCRKAVIKLDLIKPFSNYVPTITDEYSKRFLERYKNMTPPDLYVYEKDGVFIMSDDYNAYFMYKEIEAIHAVCTVIGETTITEGVEYGEPFKLQMPTIEVSE